MTPKTVNVYSTTIRWYGLETPKVFHPALSYIFMLAVWEGDNCQTMSENPSSLKTFPRKKSTKSEQSSKWS